MSKFIGFITSRLIVVGVMILLQFAFLIASIFFLSEYFVYVYAVLILLSVIAGLWVLNKRDNPAYKLAWIVPILLVPLLGGVMYILFGNKKTTRKMQRKLEVIYDETKQFTRQEDDSLDRLKEIDPNVYKQFYYAYHSGMFPVYQNTDTAYLSPGEKAFDRMMEALKSAENFIFMEYFIVQPGIMWNSILEVLEQKVKSGVDVRFIYDDVGSVRTLPYGYHKVLKEKGIQVQAFNPYTPSLSFRINNRDHRKICIVDGIVAFTGGINLADEYINEKERFGHWKDSCIMLRGQAVWNFTVMFLQIWDYCNNTRENYEMFRPKHYLKDPVESDGFVQPYGDSPLDDEILGENIYMNLINNAKDYLYINTPYFVVDNELMTALTLAAKNGIDVRIVTPGIEDKWYVHILTQGSYAQLIEAGVKVYEYTPGFIHSKTFLADDSIGAIGTVNLDYRSLYLHFECGVLLYRSKALRELKEDFLETLKVCKEITLEDCSKVPLYKKLLRIVLKLFAPML